MPKQAIHRNFNAVFRLVYHLVLVSKYRRRVFDALMLDRCKDILATLCASSGGALLECSGEADHVHALIDMPPQSPSVRPHKRAQDGSSRLLRKEFPCCQPPTGGKLSSGLQATASSQLAVRLSRSFASTWRTRPDRIDSAPIRPACRAEVGACPIGVYDGLKLAQLIQDDGPAYYQGSTHTHTTGPRPGVWVTVVPV